MKTILFLCSLTIYSCSKTEKNITQAQIDSLANSYKNFDISEQMIYKKNKKLDSLSKYKYSEIKKNYDSIKRFDSVSYYTLQKIIEADTVGNYYHDLDFNFWDENSKIKTEKEYREDAKKYLMKKLK